MSITIHSTTLESISKMSKHELIDYIEQMGRRVADYAVEVAYSDNDTDRNDALASMNKRQANMMAAVEALSKIVND